LFFVYFWNLGRQKRELSVLGGPNLLQVQRLGLTGARAVWWVVT